MDYPASVERFDELDGLQGPLHLAIGVFDGVHLGHKAVIDSAVFSARRAGGVAGVLTFDPHPSRLFRPEEPTRLLVGIDAKVRLLHSVGVDVVIRKHFDRDYASIPAECFLQELKTAIPQLAAIYVGENFRFGKKRSGDVNTLVETGAALGVGVFSVDRIKLNGMPISSTRIRGELESGKIESVNALLGYNYFAEGQVVSGARLGRTIGFPTLNLPWDPECRPCFGVYLVRFRQPGTAVWAYGVANYGVKPTVQSESQVPALEVHALEATGLDTGDSLYVEWLRFIRPEQKFESLEALKAQIAEDAATARNLAAHV
ncbi:riboflavin biosynthesis protein RibF [Coraliomargarita parva]|uniref:riboflavin biosynthesis protein RibF n=1 Tax=Coraliomargarita parva TaxID=3014050 RepID=UPI0022B39F69|nr:riboflavin biosynthesis protein RibF [Coraliomargarita parva]